MTIQLGSPFRQRPATRLGWLAFGLTAVFAVMFIINSIVFMPAFSTNTTESWHQVLLPFYGILMMLCGLAGGLLGLYTLIRKRDRSWLVWLTILPGAFVIIFLLGEFLVPH
jgi:hypothetical protein